MAELSAVYFVKGCHLLGTLLGTKLQLHLLHELVPLHLSKITCLVMFCGFRCSATTWISKTL